MQDIPYSAKPYLNRCEKFEAHPLSSKKLTMFALMIRHVPIIFHSLLVGLLVSCLSWCLANHHQQQTPLLVLLEMVEKLSLLPMISQNLSKSLDRQANPPPPTNQANGPNRTKNLPHQLNGIKNLPLKTSPTHHRRNWTQLNLLRAKKKKKYQLKRKRKRWLNLLTKKILHLQS